ncbi:adult cuticle protein 1-like [Lucilia cuprina]|uniref:adult cuticle protein 1-like n=1 Tax=Lucilia cuprina TaxID=7375 RepID=UPI001F060FE4|nr:adult cuticle protein 1-like [Lucilia cuprina]
MKFVFAVVLLALAAGVQSSLIAQHAPGVSYVTTALHPANHLGGPLGWGGHAAIDHSAWGGPLVAPLGGHGLWGGIPGISLAQGPAHGHVGIDLAHGAHGHGHGVYVAKTRGAVHTAPLAGHIASATSVNVAPAPGTH